MGLIIVWFIQRGIKLLLLSYQMDLILMSQLIDQETVSVWAGPNELRNLIGSVKIWHLLQYDGVYSKYLATPGGSEV